MRINKYIATCGVCSRRKAEELVLSGKVKLNGKIVDNLATDILDTDEVKVNEKVISLCDNFEYYLLNKPKGYVCSASDDRNRKIVTELIKTDARIYPVGRLDYDSEGLLILTNDGELTNKLTHPRNEIPKTYIAKIEGVLTTEELKALRKGVIIDNNIKLRSCLINVLSVENKVSRVEITIFEGKNREIRKMFETINKPVIFLKRIKIGNLKLGGLNRGEYRKLTNKEVAYLKSL